VLWSAVCKEGVSESYMPLSVLWDTQTADQSFGPSTVKQLNRDDKD